MARQISENFVAIPRRDATHIQKIAPGPPMAIAAAIPTILPFPTQEESAVASALKDLICPTSLPFSSLPPMFPTHSRNAIPNLRNCTPRRRMVIMIPTPKYTHNMIGPNRKLINVTNTPLIASVIHYLQFFVRLADTIVRSSGTILV